MATRRAKGEGTIVLRKDGRWEAKVDLPAIAGKRHRRSVYGRTRAEAYERKRKIESRLGRNASDLRLGEFLEQWVRDGRSRWEPQTYRTYLTWLNRHALPFLGARTITSLEPQDIRAWMRQLEDRGVGVTTRKRSLATLRSALRQLVDDEYLVRNPCDPVRGPKLKRADIRVPKPPEIKRVLKAAEPFWFFTFTLLAFTATMRQGEMFALWWSQVDLDSGTIEVNKSLAEGWKGELVRKDPKTKRSVRKLFLPSIAVTALRKLQSDQIAAGYEGPWVFPDRDGGPLRKSNFDRRHWAPLLKKAGVEHFRFHAARHAGNSILIAQGEDPLSISRRMGHVDTRMTFDTYAHLFEDGRRPALRLEQALNEAGIVPEALGLPMPPRKPLRARPADKKVKRQRFRGRRT